MKLNLDWSKSLELLAQESVLQRLVQLVNLLLLLLLAATLAEITWKLLPAPPLQAPPLRGAGGGPQAQPRVAEPAAGDITMLHLFGDKVSRPVAVAQPTEAPETRLQLILRGVFASDDPSAAGAIIAERNGKESFYGVGDKLPGGAVLKEVYKDRIVLLRGGRLETLRMLREGVANDSARLGRQSTQGGIGRAAEPSLRELRDMVLDNPQQLADKVRLSPHSEGGRMVGYQVRPGRDARFLSRFGLQPGDVVTAVNGIRLDSPARGLSILRNLAKSSQVRLEIKRNGLPQTIALDVNQ